MRSVKRRCRPGRLVSLEVEFESVEQGGETG